MYLRKVVKLLQYLQGDFDKKHDMIIFNNNWLFHQMSSRHTQLQIVQRQYYYV